VAFPLINEKQRIHRLGDVLKLGSTHI